MCDCLCFLAFILTVALFVRMFIRVCSCVCVCLLASVLNLTCLQLPALRLHEQYFELRPRRRPLCRLLSNVKVYCILLQRQLRLTKQVAGWSGKGGEKKCLYFTQIIRKILISPPPPPPPPPLFSDPHYF